MNPKKLFSIEINGTVHNLYEHQKLYKHYQSQQPHIQKANQDAMTAEFLKKHADQSTSRAS
jgi:hypothetical protein